MLRKRTYTLTATTVKGLLEELRSLSTEHELHRLIFPDGFRCQFQLEQKQVRIYEGNRSTTTSKMTKKPIAVLVSPIPTPRDLVAHKERGVCCTFTLKEFTLELIFKLSVLAVILLTMLNWFLFAPSTSCWRKWFAWYPITIDSNRVWLKTVERRKLFKGSSSETDNDVIAYRYIMNHRVKNNSS